MNEKEKNINNEEEMVEVYTLTDEDGNEIEFEVIGEYEKNGECYLAMIPFEDTDPESEIWEYVILKRAKDGDEDIFVSVDDENELDDIADYFDDFFSQIDYDN